MKRPLSDSERQQRSRAHRRGDHRLCDSSRCLVKRQRRDGVVTGEDDDEWGVTPDTPVRRLVEQLLETTDFAADDPRRVMAQVALKLADKFDEGASSPIARELSKALTFLADVGPVPGQLDEIRARHLARRVALLGQESKPATVSDISLRYTS
jgi:hypothetical protein